MSDEQTVVEDFDPDAPAKGIVQATLDPQTYRWRVLNGNGARLAVGEEGLTSVDTAEEDMLAHLSDGAAVEVHDADGNVLRSYVVGEDSQQVRHADSIKVAEGE